ncbi:MAG: DUF3891 family protein [Thermoanaerobaculia bacterium]
MIRRRSDEGWWVVTQADHARLAADLLALFRLPELIDRPRRRELLLAVREHDNGWWEADAAPRVDAATGLPLDFREAPPELRREIWRRAVERRADEEPYASALIATHALRLLADRRADDEYGEWLAALEERRAELLGASGRTIADALADDRWLELADDLSLAACLGDGRFVQTLGFRAQVETTASAVEVRLAPFPLAGTTRFALPARALPPRRYASGVDLGVELAAARWRELTVRLAPGAAD